MVLLRAPCKFERKNRLSCNSNLRAFSLSMRTNADIVLIALKKKCGLTRACNDLISASRNNLLCVSALPSSN